MGLRFTNGIFEPLWDRNCIERVEIVWEETLALEGRAGYFDHAGACKDLIQNHLIQLLCLTAMEAPTALHRRNLRDRKVDLLRAVRRLSPEEAQRQTVRARYGPGTIGERHIPAYADEEGVDPSRGTETFAEVTLMIDNLRWAGVPFVLRGDKALSRFRAEIAVHLQSGAPPRLPAGGRPQPNVLRVRLGPDRVTLNLNVNGPYDPFDLEQIELSADFAPQEFFSAYNASSSTCWRATPPSSCGRTRPRRPGGLRAHTGGLGTGTGAAPGVPRRLERSRRGVAHGGAAWRREPQSTGRVNG
jgi:glucose-6-phosphate 1-dehydrogenase